MSSRPKVISMSEAAKRLDVTTQTIREWCKKGILRYIKFPTGRYKVFEEDVEKMFNQDDHVKIVQDKTEQVKTEQDKEDGTDGNN